MIINVCVYVCMCVCMHVRMYRHKIHRQMDRLFKLHAEAPESATLRNVKIWRSNRNNNITMKTPLPADFECRLQGPRHPS